MSKVEQKFSRVPLALLLVVAACVLLLWWLPSSTETEHTRAYFFVNIPDSKKLQLLSYDGTVHREVTTPKSHRLILAPDCTVLGVGKRKFFSVDLHGVLTKEPVEFKLAPHHALEIAPDGSFYSAFKNPRDGILYQGAEYPLLDDVIARFNEQGEMLWQWSFLDYYKAANCGETDCDELSYLLMGDGDPPKRERIDWVHTNSIRLIPENVHYRNGHSEFTPGNLMIVPRNFLAIYILNPATGKIVYTLDKRDGLRFTGPHEAYIVPEGFVGAGNILLIDNTYRESKYPWLLKDDYFNTATKVLEIDPLTKKVVWEYSPETFYNDSGGAAQRLKNGNTLISVDHYGVLLEVNRAKEVVWTHSFGEKINWGRRYLMSSAGCEMG